MGKKSSHTKGSKGVHQSTKLSPRERHRRLREASLIEHKFVSTCKAQSIQELFREK